MGGAASRTKGHAWEREVAILLRPIFPNARRGLSQTRDGADVPDVDCTPYWLECKKGKRTNPRAALEQAFNAAVSKGLGGDPRPPVAICYDDRERPVAMMYLDDWLALVQRAHAAPPPDPVRTVLDSILAGLDRLRVRSALDALLRALDAPAREG